MTSRDFCYWLQGYFELSALTGHKFVSPEQTAMIRRHLALVFTHEIDPSIDKGNTTTAAVLQALHDGTIMPPAPPKSAGNGDETLYRC